MLTFIFCFRGNQWNSCW